MHPTYAGLWLKPLRDMVAWYHVKMRDMVAWYHVKMRDMVAWYHVKGSSPSKIWALQ